MFGKKNKNKKTEEKEKNTNNIIMHTMQDDLSLDIKNLSASEDIKKDKDIMLKSNSPFSSSKSGVEELKKENDIPKKTLSDAINKLNIDKKSLVFKSNKVQENFSDISTDPKQDIKPKQKVDKPISFNKVSKEKSYPMPKSVNNITVGVENERAGKEKNEAITLKSDNKKDADNKKEKNFKEPSGSKNVFGYLAAIIIVILLGAGGYFMWSSNNAKNIIIEEPISTEEPVVIEKPIDDPGIFSDKVNFLTISSEELNKDNLLTAINEKFTEMNKSQHNFLEFMLVNENNDPIAFETFAEIMEIKLPITNKDHLSSDFSIFLYINKINTIGLSIKTVDPESILSNMEDGESLLTKGIAPIFTEEVSDESMENSIFSSSVYNEINIKYVNLTENTSVDYAVLEDYLIIATSKDSGRSIIDKILLEDAIEEENYGSSALLTDKIASNENETSIIGDSVEVKDIFNEVEQSSEDGTIITP